MSSVLLSLSFSMFAVAQALTSLMLLIMFFSMNKKSGALCLWLILLISEILGGIAKNCLHVFKFSF